jgi:hypothetical protein
MEPIDLKHLQPETAAAFDKHVKEHHSRITNMKATMGRSVLTFEIYMRWYDLYEQVKGIVGARAAYLLCHSISMGSNCPLCTTYFRKLIIDNGEKPNELVLSDAEQILLDFGSAVAQHKGDIPNEIYNAMKSLYTETEMIVLTGFAGQMIATNIFSNVFEVEIDEYLASYVSVNSK